MNRLASLVAIGCLLVSLFAVGQTAADVLMYRLAELADLAVYPDLPASCEAVGEGLVAVILPGTEIAVVLRPIPWEEYGSYQVQAVSHDMIERQMLAAAIVVPSVTEIDMMALSPELVALLQRRVNAISGYAVFSVLP